MSKVIFLWQLPGETNSRDGLDLRRFATHVFCSRRLLGSSVRVPTHEE